MNILKAIHKSCEPTKGSKYSAFIDLYASHDAILKSNETTIIGLGVVIDMAFDHDFFMTHYLQLEPRSSLRAKGIIAGSGIIDMDFKSEIGIILTYILRNNPLGYYTIKRGDRIAQIALMEHKTPLMGIDTDTERSGGFGSTDNNLKEPQ